MHYYDADAFYRAHTDDLLREAQQEHLAAQLPRNPPLRHRAAAELGILLIHVGKRLAQYAYARLA
jgi:hypothetical protein